MVAAVAGRSAGPASPGHFPAVQANALIRWHVS